MHTETHFLSHTIKKTIKKLEHFKGKHAFSCGLIKLKVDVSDAELAPELPGNYRAVKREMNKGVTWSG